MKSLHQITFITPLSGKWKTNGINLSVLTIVITMALSSCRKDVGPAISFPVNKTFETDLISKGVPADIAQFFAAVRTETSSPNDTTCIYLQTFPNGATRKITLGVSPNRKYAPTPDEIANTTPGSNPIYDFKFTSIDQADGSTKINMNYFVPKSGLPTSGTVSPALMIDQNRSIRLMYIASGADGTEGAGISWEEIGNKGNDVTIGSLIDYASEKGIKLGPLGPIYYLASALSDVTTALELSKQNTSWLEELNALEKCAANPTNRIALSDPNYSTSAVEKVNSARSELKEVNAVRFLNIMTEKAADLNPVTAVLGIGMKQGFVWSEKTLNDYSENTIMREAKLFIVPCTDQGALDGNIDILHDCTSNDGINVIRTQWHTQTRINWIYDPMKAQYYSSGSYTFDYKQTITGGGTSCTINRSAAGDLGVTGMLIVISDPVVRNFLGYSYTAAGNLDAQVSMTSNCQGYTPQMQNWTVVWLPLIKAFTGTGGSYSGERIDSCASGTGSEKITWSFIVPPAK